MSYFDVLSDPSDTLKEMLSEKDVFIVDVRTPQEFVLGNFEGAINIPLEELPGRVEEVRSKTHVVVYCHSGHRSDHAKKFLLRNGIDNVLNGGNHLLLEEIVSS